MSDLQQTLPASTVTARKDAFGQRLLPICYFGAIAIAMAGWVWAIGWVVLATANWLLA